MWDVWFLTTDWPDPQSRARWLTWLDTDRDVEAGKEADTAQELENGVHVPIPKTIILLGGLGALTE